MVDKWYSNLSEKQKQRYNEQRKQAWAQRTPEQIQKNKEEAKQRYLNKLASFTPEQLAEYKKKVRLNWEEYAKKLPEEKKQQIRNKIRENNNLRYRNLSPEEKEKQLIKMRQRNSNLTKEQRAYENLRTKQIREKRKQEVISHYSNGTMKCFKCGYQDIRALSIDHINGGGRKQIRTIRKTRFYDWIVKNNYPSGLQVLCMNCQFIKKIENKEDKPPNKKL